MRTTLQISVASVALVACGLSACDGSGRVEQKEVTMVVENQLDQERYVDWSTLGQGLVSYESYMGGAWEPCQFELPYCKELCTDENKLVGCCSFCITSLKVRVIEPGGSIHIFWDGKLYSEDENHCFECSCWWDEKPKRGKHRAEVCVSDSYTCELEPCSGPDGEGVIRDARTSGSSSCHEVEFSVEYGEETLTIPIH